MPDADLASIVLEIGDEAILVDAAPIDRFSTLLPRLEGRALRLIVVADAETRGDIIAPLDGVEVVAYGALFAECKALDLEVVRSRADPPEDQAAAICHTGGPTGKPKAVVYSHRSLWLQAMSLCTANSLALSRTETHLPAVPLRRVNGWGLPFAAIMAGANMVLAGNSFGPDHRALSGQWRSRGLVRGLASDRRYRRRSRSRAVASGGLARGTQQQRRAVHGGLVLEEADDCRCGWLVPRGCLRASDGL